MIEMNIQLYWGPKAEELETLVLKAIEHLAEMKGLGPPFETWVRPGKSRKIALAGPVINPTDPEEVRMLFLKGRNWTDFPPRTVIPELGYHFGLWNRAFGDVDATFSIRCGVNSEFLSQDAQNLLNLRAAAREGLPSDDAAINQVFLRFADVWKPQSGRAWIKRMAAEHTVAAL
ncbi:MAG: hypothetical protein EON58_10255 [Alphaproteobacteria bacterium]|uniref:hypothetical protein n=1 Tax=Rhizobium sp. CFBP 13726 TaxID=2775296 RepID=UPI0010E1A508|nr:hypothetical protein [Rhizobium sp. CFBP 13726]MBD8651123.1 hypothetical protein [Rhizobium sp. CFBP 13726]RYG97228.1 MAG: hypothetical protein EON58_10255 [Alphaproteobacteria bacterium]